MISVALPKGRLGKDVYQLLSQIGYSCEELLSDDRKLVFDSPDGAVRYMLVKPSDVAIYVECGGADIGVVGKDTLLETEPDIYELLDLNYGKCRLAVAGKNGWTEDKSLPLRVATKYPNVAKKYYDSISRRIEITKLNGSIELAPIIGLSDVIVDIVESGETLRRNNLSEFITIEQSSARLIANKSAFQFKKEQINDMVEKLKKLI